MEDFSHFDESGRAHMVDITAKGDTVRTATAAGRVLVNEETFRLIRTGGMKKGDVLGTAQIAGIMGAKRTPDIIPMCHPILLKGVDVSFSPQRNRSGGGDHRHSPVHRRHRRGDGGPYRCLSGGTDSLRHVQGGTEGYGH